MFQEPIKKPLAIWYMAMDTVIMCTSVFPNLSWPVIQTRTPTLGHLILLYYILHLFFPRQFMLNKIEKNSHYTNQRAPLPNSRNLAPGWEPVVRTAPDRQLVLCSSGRHWRRLGLLEEICSRVLLKSHGDTIQLNGSQRWRAGRLARNRNPIIPTRRLRHLRTHKHTYPRKG